MFSSTRFWRTSYQVPYFAECSPSSASSCAVTAVRRRSKKPATSRRCGWASGFALFVSFSSFREGAAAGYCEEHKENVGRAALTRAMFPWPAGPPASCYEPPMLWTTDEYRGQPVALSMPPAERRRTDR